MKLRKVTAASATIFALALTATACGGGDGDNESSGGGGKDKITIGIKFDQPGLGQKTPQGYEGFDVDVATYVAKKLGYEENQIEWKESKSADRETMLQRGDVDFIAATYSITPERQEKVDFVEPVPARPPGRAAPRRRRQDQVARGPEQREAVLRHRLDVRAERQGEAGAQGAAAAVPDVLRLPARSAERRRRRADHGRLDPHAATPPRTSSRASSSSAASS